VRFAPAALQQRIVGYGRETDEFAIRVGALVEQKRYSVGLSDEQRLDWLRLIRSQNVGPRGLMAQVPQAP
jgi:hypothetical protein